MTVTQQQNLLQYLGYYEGRVDGINGPLTEGAIAAFRADNGNPNLGDELEEVLIGAVFHGRFKGSVAPDAEPDGDFWNTVQYFGRHEFACKCGKCGGYPVEPKERLVRALDEIREETGLPVYINSGVRCPEHNEA
ncbi:MAG: peptidoglycan-binding protein, partial [Oscillospiraceae bacterium]|nr:peptidoglycan-binding protein [Oscillospiraceae bacterium]